MLEALKRPLEQLPIALSGTVPIYHSSQLPPNLHLSGPVLAGIFLGRITSWNFPEIAKINPDAKLPDMAITVVHRADWDGSSDRLSSYLSQWSPEWKERFGASVDAWPVGRTGKGDEGVAGQVNEIEGAIGYVSYGFPIRESIQTAVLENLRHQFVAASPASIAAGFQEIGDLSNLPESSSSSHNGDAYPVAGITWLLLSPPDDPKRGITLLDFIRYSLTGDRGRQTELGSGPAAATPVGSRGHQAECDRRELPESILREDDAGQSPGFCACSSPDSREPSIHPAALMQIKTTASTNCLMLPLMEHS